MKQHFLETIDVRILPPPDARSLAQRLTAASREWDEVRQALAGYSSSPKTTNGTVLFMSLSRFVHELIPDRDLRERMIQYLETQIKKEFPPPAGKLL